MEIKEIKKFYLNHQVFFIFHILFIVLLFLGIVNMRKIWYNQQKYIKEYGMQIKHDFHIHTSLSVCAKETATVEHYFNVAQRLGLNKIGFSDHFWDSSFDAPNDFYRTQDYEHVSRLKPMLENAPEGLNVYFGCEAEYDPKRRDVGITEETAEKFDFIIVPNSHTHMMMPKDFYEPYEKHAEFMIESYNNILDSKVSKYITAMAHPFMAVACPYNNGILIDMIPDDTYKRLFDKTANKGIAFEINISSMHGKTKEQIEALSQIRIFRLAKQCGCKFLFGTDSHNDQRHSSFSNAEFVAEILELKETDIADIAR